MAILSAGRDASTAAMRALAPIILSIVAKFQPDSKHFCPSHPRVSDEYVDIDARLTTITNRLIILLRATPCFVCHVHEGPAAWQHVRNNVRRSLVERSSPH